MTSIALEITRTSKWDCIKIIKKKNLLHRKEALNRVKRQTRPWETIFI
jgi:hypothetical protein